MNRRLDNLGYAVCLLAMFALFVLGVADLGRAVADEQRREASLPRLERVTVTASRVDGRALQPARVADVEATEPVTRATQ